MTNCKIWGSMGEHSCLCASVQALRHRFRHGTPATACGLPMLTPIRAIRSHNRVLRSDESDWPPPQVIQHYLCHKQVCGKNEMEVRKSAIFSNSPGNLPDTIVKWMETKILKMEKQKIETELHFSNFISHTQLIWKNINRNLITIYALKYISNNKTQLKNHDLIRNISEGWLCFWDGVLGSSFSGQPFVLNVHNQYQPRNRCEFALPLAPQANFTLEGFAAPSTTTCLPRVEVGGLSFCG